MPTATPILGTATAVTITLASLATDATAGGPFVGRSSAVLVLDAIDVMVSGIFRTHSTAPTAGTRIEVWSYSAWDNVSGTPAYTGGATGTDAALTTNARNKPLMRLITVIAVDATVSADYPWGPFSIAQAYGGFIPTRFGIFVTHNTGQILNATAGTNTMYYQVLNFESI